MTCIIRSSFLLLLCGIISPLTAQDHGIDSTVQTRYRISGIAFDIFPLINGIFSDDPSTDLFGVNYLWGNGSFHHEVGFAPVFRRSDSESNDPVLKEFGFSLRLFHGKRHAISKRWFVIPGMTYQYMYLKQTSKNSVSTFFTFKTTEHTGGLGPQLMFGFEIADQVWIRSRITGLLQYSSIVTKIDDGPVQATEQKLSILNFNITSPTILELAYIF